MKQPKKTTQPLLLVTWLDAGVITHGDWITKEEALQEASPVHFLNQTVGWLLHENQQAIVLASQLATDEKEPRYDLVMYVPKSLIRTRKVIKL